MYHYVSAISRIKDPTGFWSTEDISTIPLNTLFDTYRAATAILSNDLLDYQVSFNLWDLQNELRNTSKTLTEWLAGIGNRTLPTSRTLPNLDRKYMYSTDAYQAGFTVAITDVDVDPSQSPPLADRTDLLLTKDGVDYEKIEAHCLATVNGLIHRTSGGKKGFYILNGAVSGKLANDNHLGILNFQSLGTLTKLPITDAMILPRVNELAYRHGVYLKVPQSIKGKTVALVIGGYLHLHDRSYQVVGEDLLRINFAHIPLVERYFRTRDNIDLTGLPIDMSDAMPGVISVSELYSDAAIKAYLQLSQSFMVLIDNTELDVEYARLQPSQIPGRFYSYTEPKGMFRTGLGETAEAWVYKEGDDRWCVSIENYLRDNRVFDTYQYLDSGNDLLSDVSVMRKPVDYAPCMLMQISKLGS